MPVEIGQLTQLTTLNLSANKLTELPVEIGNLTQLITLNLYNGYILK
jgi:Leucine-rich repeat (LRR) protein